MSNAVDEVVPVPAVGPSGESILHTDVTTTQITPGHPTVTWREEFYAQLTPPYLTRGIRRCLPGTPPDTEGAFSLETGEQIYDPTDNTIYAPPRPEPKPGAHRVTPAQAARMSEPYMSRYIATLRAKLASGKASVVGRATVDGRAALKLKFARSDEIDYVAADGSYAPIKMIRGSGSSKDVQLINLYHTFEYLPAAGNAGLLSLTAQHPSAKVNTSRCDFLAALSRLYPNG